MSKFYAPEILKRVQNEEMGILKDFIAVCEENDLRYFAIAGTGIGAVRHGGFIPWDDDIDVAMPRADFEKAMAIIEEKYSDKYYILNGAHDSRYPLMTTRLCIRNTRFVEEAVKDVDCPFGIFLDLYAYDNLADGKFAYHRQVWTAWFWSKLLILRSVPHPYIGLTGWKYSVAQGICAFVHGAMKVLHISPSWLYRRCLHQCRKYENVETKRMGYPCDTDPNWNTVLKEDIYPVQEYKFEDIMLKFPHNLDAMLRNFYGDYMVMPPEDKRKTHYPYILDFGDGINVAE